MHDEQAKEIFLLFFVFSEGKKFNKNISFQLYLSSSREYVRAEKTKEWVQYVSEQNDS